MACIQIEMRGRQINENGRKLVCPHTRRKNIILIMEDKIQAKNSLELINNEKSSYDFNSNKADQQSTVMSFFNAFFSFDPAFSFIPKG